MRLNFKGFFNTVYGFFSGVSLPVKDSRHVGSIMEPKTTILVAKKEFLLRYERWFGLF